MEDSALHVVDMSKLHDSLVIHFETANKSINAYTLASSLVGLADAAKAANASLNLGYDIEVVVEALGPGSFRAKLRAVYRTAKNLFSDHRVQAIILNIVAAFIYEHYLAENHDVKIDINPSEILIESGHDRIIVPRQVYDATRTAAQSQRFIASVEKTLDSIGRDEKVTGIGFVTDMDAPPPAVLIPHKFLQEIKIPFREDPLTRFIEESCDLQIVKAILDRSDRKWEFMWRGVKISAPVLSDSFYSRFFAHSITIAPGDELQAKLRIKQSRDIDLGIYTNIGYEVIEVYEHVPRVRQVSLTAD